MQFTPGSAFADAILPDLPFPSCALGYRHRLSIPSHPRSDAEAAGPQAGSAPPTGAVAGDIKCCNPAFAAEHPSA
jgi:hypothetical protein